PGLPTVPPSCLSFPGVRDKAGVYPFRTSTVKVSMAQTLTEWKDLIPELDALPARPKRIILHWTGGTYEPNSLELEHYHFLVDGEGVVHPGTHSVADNMRKLQKGDDYAAHTRGYNSFSVGIAFCGM